MKPFKLALSYCPASEQDHHEVQRLIPAGSPWVFLDWPLSPDELDSAILKSVAELICAALLGCGKLAFRWDKDNARPPGQNDILPGYQASFLSRLSRMLFFSDRGDAFDVMTTTDIQSAPALFAWGGWTWGGQAALIFDPGTANIDAIASELRHGLDWRNRVWLPGVRLLFGSGHDGASAVVSAVDENELNCFVDRLRRFADDSELIDLHL